jgi:hypothetical protein
MQRVASTGKGSPEEATAASSRILLRFADGVRDCVSDDQESVAGCAGATYSGGVSRGDWGGAGAAAEDRDGGGGFAGLF